MDEAEAAQVLGDESRYRNEVLRGIPVDVQSIPVIFISVLRLRDDQAADDAVVVFRSAVGGSAGADVFAREIERARAAAAVAVET